MVGQKKKKKEEYEKNLRVSLPVVETDLHMFNPGFVTRQREVLASVCNLCPSRHSFPSPSDCLPVCLFRLNNYYN